MNEKLLSRILAFGAAFTTIFVISDGVTDPVNVTKLLPLGIAGTAAFGLLCATSISGIAKEFKLAFTFVGIFLLAALNSLVFSNSPISQGIYGAYGRNNGLVTYVFLSFALLAALAFKSRNSFSLIAKGILFAGLVNIAYCLWVILFGDFIGWTNPYGNILGTFGNPNFIGAFLGIFLAASVGFVLDSSSHKWLRLVLFFTTPITIFEIYDSQAIQGRVVGVAGLALIGFFYIKSRFNFKFLLFYSLISTSVGFLAALGALQIGPLTSLIYKRSVSLRGQYWLAGWNTGESHPFTGVGMDSFGDWYRRSRDSHALELPGINTVVNAAHNVPLDMFAFGGWPLFISYLSIMTLGAIALIRMVARSKQFDPLLAVLATSWFGYQLQSIISINQIGLAVWGWLLTGCVIAYEKFSRDNSTGQTISNIKPPKKVIQEPKVVLVVSTFAMAGFLIALPPLVADSKWRNAQVIASLPALEATMQGGLLNPQNSMRYLTNIQILEQNQQPVLAHKYALEAVEWNPDAFDLWKALYLIQNSTPNERSLALMNMKRLDPMNPDVTSTQ